MTRRVVVRPNQYGALIWGVQIMDTDRPGVFEAAGTVNGYMALVAYATDNDAFFDDLPAEVRSLMRRADADRLGGP
jgi:hypothetical protein